MIMPLKLLIDSRLTAFLFYYSNKNAPKTTKKGPFRGPFRVYVFRSFGNDVQPCVERVSDACQRVQAGGVSPVLDAGDVGLNEARRFGEVFLRHALLPAEFGDACADSFSLVHNRFVFVGRLPAPGYC